MTQPYLRGQGFAESIEVLLGVLPSSSLTSLLVAGSDFMTEGVRGNGLSFGLSLFETGVTGLGPTAFLPQSKAVPGVFGVFEADPNDAKAPVPRPKAEEAPVEGEAMPEVLRGEIMLKGLERPPCEPSPPPKRDLDAEMTRDG